MIILARPDATVAMGWPIAHEKTSHGSPTEPTGRPVQRPVGGWAEGLGSDRSYVKYDFSGTPWRWVYWRRRVPVTPMGNYLT